MVAKAVVRKRVAPPPEPPPAPPAAGLMGPWRVPALGVVTAVWVGLLVAWAYLSYAHTSTLVSLGGDNAVYGLTSRYFQSLVLGVADPVAAHAAAESVYPPLYPLMLALAGAGRQDSWLSGNLVTTGLLLAALAFFYLWMLRRGQSWVTALAATLALVVMPGVWRQTVLLQSENLYLLTTLAALYWLEGAGLGPRRLVMTPQGAAMMVPWTERLGAAPGLVLIALAMLTRTAGVALLAGVVAAWAWGRVLPGLAYRAPLANWRVGRVLGGLVLVAVPLGLWNIVHRPEVPYATSMARTYGDEGGSMVSALLAQSLTELEALADAWPELFGLSPRLVWLVWVVAGLGLAGLLWRAARGRADGWYVLGYLVMIVVWPFPAEAERFLLVILPMVWAAALEGLGVFVAWLRRRRHPGETPGARATGLPAGLLAGAMLLALGPGVTLALGAWFAARPIAGQPTTMEDWRHRPIWYRASPLDEREQRAAAEDTYRAMHAALARLTPAGACVLSPKPSLSMVFGHRLAWGIPRPALDAAAFEAEVRRRGCRYVLAMASPTPSFPAFYPLTRLTGVATVQALPTEGRQTGELATLKPSALATSPSTTPSR